jgi:3-oxoacyl-[acyl-carrier-protein] synthase III
MVVAVDVLSPQLGAADPRTQAIFSDVAVCYVIQYNPEARSGVILSGPVTGSEYRDGLQLGHNDTDKIKMKGEKVRKSILGLVPLAVERARKYGNNDLIQINQTRSEEDSVLVDLDELAVIASHLPSDVMFAEIATILEHNGYSRDRMPNNFALLGNSSAATTLANLDKIIRDGLLPAGELYGLLSAAVGATAILNVLRYNES